ncbi:pirin family protein [Pseudoalteromonas sp. A601]|uniref:pirin family protein n=1 Tax=Pseudoalteromonas sp. A601 TaxID=1967839 RepID=UPI0020CF7550|nr:pirin-like C-terminal cupin domain-containing protein [Pseudoalteromonas sp. A601]
MTTAGYQALHSDVIPVIDLPNNAGTLRPIAGEFEGTTGPAHTHSPMQVWDTRLNAGGQAGFHLPDGWTASLVVLEGAVCVNRSWPVTEGQLVLLSRGDTSVEVHAQVPSLVLVLSGEPLNEPVVGHGPFVMNNKSEILQAFDDLENNCFGRL